ncbi:MAG: bifunctional DNA-formamidopyrimidine glycosylase/DNA-(apurinic or apyrimidinic site) lyase [Phycisphaerae bacterium]|nr:bifunctional DNA-formamidopyrimidine glycosylase/DNA-(apurinic or apyrimidinic site) lyase [Phycisphaerae bacterium]
MPELPEVETVVRTLRPHLIGRALGDILVADRRVLRTPRSRLASRSARQLQVAAVERIGKFIRIRLCPAVSCGAPAPGCQPPAKQAELPSPLARTMTPEGGCPTKRIAAPDNLTLAIHLGMSGRLLVVPADSPVPNHTYFRIHLHSEFRIPHSELRFQNPRWCMGGLWLTGDSDPLDPAAALGPDPLRISRDEFAALLRRHRRQIKALLLDQAALAGMGNIYSDESLFAASIHPRAIASRLSAARAARLWSAMRDRLSRAIRRGGSTLRDYRNADGESGWFQLALKVYGRTGQPCPACGSAIRHNVTAGRSTHFCPRCQKR